MARRRVIKLSKKEARAKARRFVATRDSQTETLPAPAPTNQKVVLPQIIQVRKLAELLKQPVNVLIEQLVKNNIFATVNQSIDFDTAAIITDEFGFQAIPEKATAAPKATVTGKVATRPPVVAVMGHVDHGKTKLLDAIRKTNVAGGESGGITQHIGAYQVEISLKEKGKTTSRAITFIDTPGHEAFSAMRSHGANITDLVVLVVAADDGVKPQTIEAISHARAAKAPIIVAINKVDLPAADPERVKRELLKQNLVAEQWGGKTPMIPISATRNQGIDQLLEIIALSADLEELKYHPNADPASGIIVESHLEHGKGAVATLLVRDGTLKKTNYLIYGDTITHARTICDDKNNPLFEVPASRPVQVTGFKTPPEVGRIFYATDSAILAKQLASETGSLAVKTEPVQSGNEKSKKTLNVILRADTQGSLQAIEDSIKNIASDQAAISVLSVGIGNVTESDINLASTASNSVILAFRVAIPPAVDRLSRAQKIPIKKFSIIYELIDTALNNVNALIEPEIIETKIGQLKVLQVFRHTPREGIFGGKITSGEIRPGLTGKIYRDDELVGEIIIKSVQLNKTDVPEAAADQECGIAYSGQAKIKPDDKVEFYHKEEVVPKAVLKTANSGTTKPNR